MLTRNNNLFFALLSGTNVQNEFALWSIEKNRHFALSGLTDPGGYRSKIRNFPHNDTILTVSVTMYSNAFTCNVRLYTYHGTRNTLIVLCTRDVRDIINRS